MSKKSNIKKKKHVPYSFVIDELISAEPYTKSMFGCTAVYVEEKIVLILRERESFSQDNGIWIATTAEHHESLKNQFPSIRSIGLLGNGITGWQNLPQNSSDFEEAALSVCKLVLKKDPRIGTVPKRKKPPSFRKAAHSKQKSNKS